MSFSRHKKRDLFTWLFGGACLRMRKVLLPLIDPPANTMLCLRATLGYTWIWCGIELPFISVPHCQNRCRIIGPPLLRSFLYNLFLPCSGIISRWYSHSQRALVKLCQPCLGSSSYGLSRDFPGGRTSFISPQIAVPIGVLCGQWRDLLKLNEQIE